MLELVRYIHLNPLRAKLVGDLRGLAGYLYSGHQALMGKGIDTDAVARHIADLLNIDEMRVRAPG